MAGRDQTKAIVFGGIKDKALAAYRAGISEVILPHENEKDVEDIPHEIRDLMQFHLVQSMDEVLAIALDPVVNETGSFEQAGESPSSSPDQGSLAH